MRHVFIFATLLAFAAVPAQATSLHGKADRVLTAMAPEITGWQSVVVRLAGELTPEYRSILAGLGGDIYRHLPLIDSVALRIPKRNLERLAALPFIVHLSADLAVKKSDEFTTEHSLATTAWTNFGVNGKNVGIAVVDSGVDINRPDIAANCVAAVSFAAGENGDPLDRTGHGTHVAGILVGNGDASKSSAYRTFRGVAQGAKIISVKVLNRGGNGTVADTVAGLQWVLNNKNNYNIRVVNLSLGHAVGESFLTDPLCQAVEALWRNGIVVVCAAGNNGRVTANPVAGTDNEGYGTNYGSVQVPANDPFVITVGAIKQLDNNRANDRIATYSSRGPSRLDYILKPDILAPGNRVISVMGSDGSLIRTPQNTIYRSEYITGANKADVSTDYLRLSGTSMAAPVVSGAVALLLQKSPNLSPDTVKVRLMLSATKWASPTGTSDPCTYGAGLLNINAALSSNAVAYLPAVSPILYRDLSGKVYISLVGLLSGSQVIWGVSGVSDLRSVWGSQVIWGASLNTLSASQVIWGQSVWYNQVIWGTNSTVVDLTTKVLNGE